MSWQYQNPGPHVLPVRPVGRSAALAIVSICLGLAALLFSVVHPLHVLVVLLGVGAVATGTVSLVQLRPRRPLAITGVVSGGTALLVVAVWTAVSIATSAIAAGSWFGDLSQGSGDDGYVGEYGYGQVATLDDYSVSVLSMHPGADSGTVYVDVAVTFTGAASGHPRGDSYNDLYGYAYDSQGDYFDALDCDADVSPDAADLAPLSVGETARFQFCFQDTGPASDLGVEVVDGQGAGSYADWTPTGDGSDGGSGDNGNVSEEAPVRTLV